MAICANYELDPACARFVEDGEIGEGCISCRHCHPITGCRVSRRGKDAGDGRTYVSDSGARYTLEDETDIHDEEE